VTERATAAAQAGAAAVTVRAPAKVNVGLAVGGLRTDGFHGLANVFLAVGLSDEVTASPCDHGAGVRITVSGPDAALVPAGEDNLAARAARLLARSRRGVRAGVRLGVRLHLAKDIPVAGGMAGGSADAAAALLACDLLWGLDTPRDELLEMGAELGSDVPFALLGGAAVGRGRGELLTPLEVGGDFHWVFAAADGGLSTPEVYGECDRLREAAGGGAGADAVPEPEPSPELLDALRTGDAHRLAAVLANDLQPAAISLRPSLSGTLAAGREAGALAGIVSGSGPTCAFLAADAASAARVADALNASGSCRTARTADSPARGAHRVA